MQFFLRRIQAFFKNTVVAKTFRGGTRNLWNSLFLVSSQLIFQFKINTETFFSSWIFWSVFYFNLINYFKRIYNNESEMFIPDPSTYIITDHQRNNHKTTDDQSYSSYSDDLLHDENALCDHDVYSSTLTHSPAPDRKFQFPQGVALNPSKSKKLKVCWIIRYCLSNIISNS